MGPFFRGVTKCEPLKASQLWKFLFLTGTLVTNATVHSKSSQTFGSSPDFSYRLFGQHAPGRFHWAPRKQVASSHKLRIGAGRLGWLGFQLQVLLPTGPAHARHTLSTGRWGDEVQLMLQEAWTCQMNFFCSMSRFWHFFCCFQYCITPIDNFTQPNPKRSSFNIWIISGLTQSNWLCATLRSRRSTVETSQLDHCIFKDEIWHDSRLTMWISMLLCEQGGLALPELSI